MSAKKFIKKKNVTISLGIDIGGLVHIIILFKILNFMTRDYPDFLIYRDASLSR